MKLYLERAYLPDESATLGRLTLPIPERTRYYTLELPWVGNAQGQSCIPEGVYPLRLRESPVVQRTSRQRYKLGWEVTEVPKRSYIMFHVGNWAHNTDGCILLGERFAWHPQHGAMVAESMSAFSNFMDTLDREEEHTIDVRCLTISYP